MLISELRFTADADDKNPGYKTQEYFKEPDLLYIRLYVDNIQHFLAKVKFPHSAQERRGVIKIIVTSSHRHIVTLLAESTCGWGIEGVTEM